MFNPIRSHDVITNRSPPRPSLVPALVGSFFSACHCYKSLTNLSLRRFKISSVELYVM